MAERARGLFLVLEGVEGSGKSTQAKLLGGWLAGAGVAHVLTREPGGTPLGEEIRRALLHGGEVVPRAELLLLLAARASLVDQVVAPALARGEVVIADRFELSTLAYQGGGRELPMEEVRRLNEFATRGLRPDLTILLDVELATGEARRRGTRAVDDRIERESAAFHARVAAAYRLLAEASGTERVDGMGTVDEVQGRLRAVLRRRFPETFATPTG